MAGIRNVFWTLTEDKHPAPARSIPENSKVRRILTFDEEPENKNVKQYVINSTEEVNRILAADAARSARRWNYDISKDEPIDGNWIWETELFAVGDRKRKLEEDEQDIEDNARKIRKEKERLMQIHSTAAEDNTVNSLMDDTRDCYAESLQHWNFDFDEGKPSDGPVVWQKVGSHWIGNKAGTTSRVVFYPVKKENNMDDNTTTAQESNNDDKTEANNNEIDLEKLLTENVNVVYGDGHREMYKGVPTVEIRSTKPFIDGEMHNYLNTILAQTEHRQFDKYTVINMLKDIYNEKYENKEIKALSDKDLSDEDKDNEKPKLKTVKRNVRVPGGLFLQLN